MRPHKSERKESEQKTNKRQVPRSGGERYLMQTLLAMQKALDELPAALQSKSASSARRRCNARAHCLHPAPAHTRLPRAPFCAALLRLTTATR